MEWNRYVYTANNPIKWNDPSGLYSFNEFKATVISVAGSSVVALQRFGQAVSDAVLRVYIRFIDIVATTDPMQCALANALGIPVYNFACGTQASGRPFGGSNFNGDTPDAFEGDYEGGIGDPIVVAGGNGSGNNGFGCSFTPDTLVSTADGEKPIVDITVGDFVYAYDEATKGVKLREVTAAFAHLDPTIIELTIDGEVIETTPEHPFYTDEAEWVAAENLTVGDSILSLDGTYGDVESITVSHDPQMMYNLSVDVSHTFAVGDGRWVVHNQCPLGDLTPEEIAAIQAVVDKAGRPLEVVGSAARGQRTPTSDIDYTTAASNKPYFRDIQHELPDIDSHGVLLGLQDSSDGPAIRFEPFEEPVFLVGADK